MPATILIERHTGAATADGGTTKTDITTINTRASVADVHKTTETTDPIPIPTAGNNYSFWVSTRLNCTVTPAGTVNNVKWFSDGVSFGTGVTVTGAKASTGANVGYREATSAIVLNQTNHTGLDAAPVDVTTLTSGSPLSIVGSISNPSTGRFGDLFVYSFDIGTSATAGATAQNTFTWQYDET